MPTLYVESAKIELTLDRRREDFRVERARTRKSVSGKEKWG